MECLIVIVNGDYEVVKKRYSGKTLIVDISDNPDINPVLLQKRIDNFLEKELFSGVKKIYSNDLINDKIKKIKYYKDKLIDLSKSYPKIRFTILSGLIWLVIYLLYLLGYSFLYGFYFSGEMDGSIALNTILVQYIPFKMPTAVIMGGLYIFIVALICYGIYEILINRDFKSKLIVIIMFLIVIVYLALLIMNFFVGNNSTTNFYQYIYILVSLAVLPFTIIILVLNFNVIMYKAKNNVNALFYVVLILAFEGKLFVDLLPTEMFAIMILYSLLIFFPIICGLINFLESKYYKKRYKILYNTAVTFPLALISSFILMLRFSEIQEFKYKALIPFLIMFIIINVNKLIKKMRSKIKNKKYDSNDKVNIKQKSSKISDGTIMVTIVFATMLSAVVLSAIGIIITLEMGRFFRANLFDHQIDIIKYGTKDDIVIGKIVAKDGDTYYISTYPKYDLITLKNQNIISEPCYELSLPKDPEELMGNLRLFFDNNELLKSNNFVTVIEKNPNNLDKMKVNYRIVIYNDQEVVYQCEISYKFDEIDNLLQLKILINKNKSYIESANYFEDDVKRILFNGLELPELNLNCKTQYCNYGILNYSENNQDDIFLNETYTLELYE